MGISIMEVIIAILVICGMVFTLGGAIGLIRFPDSYCRMHALSKGSTLGIICLMLAAVCYFIWSGIGFRVQSILALFFIFMTAPVGAHMISKAAYHYGVPLWKGSVKDDLAKNCEHIREDYADY